MLFKPEIKICGLTSEAEVEWVVKERADYAGFVLYFPKSKRNLAPEQAGRLLQALKKSREEETALSAAGGKKDAAGSFPTDKKTNVMDIPRSVAVVVSPTPVQVREIRELGFDYIQIHGTISEETLSELTLPVIRAVNVRSGETADGKGVLPAEEFIRHVKKQVGLEREQLGERLFACLFDAAKPGSGQVFDWELLSRMRLPKVKVFLAGGLNGENVRAAVRAVMPDVVDVSSGVELSPKTVGKDYAKIKEFVRKVRTDE